MRLSAQSPIRRIYKIVIKKQMFKNKKKGFTLIELLVVIAIIGILSSIVLASLNSARKKSRDARRVADIKQIQLALELYFDANNSYATSTANLAPTYIASIPSDPLGGVYPYKAYTGSSVTQTEECTGTATCLYYHLGANLEEAGAATKSDRDIDVTPIFGEDSDGCNNESGRVCYDVTP